MKCLLTGLFLAVPALASRKNPVVATEQTSMTSREVVAFQQVAENCHSDVKRLCETNVDPFYEFLSFPSRSMLTQDFGSIMDRMMETAFRMPPIQSTWIIVAESREEDSPQPPPEDQVVQHLITQIAAITHPDDIKEVSNRVVEHGLNLLRSEDASEDEVRIARRLTEVSPSLILEQRNSFLPFDSAQKNQCLQDAYRQRAVSVPCGIAMYNLERVRAVQHMERMNRIQEEKYILFELLVLYLLVVGTMVILFMRRKGEIKASRRLKIRILQAIYSKPELKASIENELGESLGHVPPLPWHVLMRFGLYGQEFRRFIKTARIVRLMLSLILCVLLLVAPAQVLPVCLGMAIYLFWTATCSTKPVRMCTCCCCGANTENAKEGTLTEDQACCNCCKGTGVCAVECADCCDPGDKVACCCDSCDCCSSGSCCGGQCCCSNKSDTSKDSMTDCSGCCCCCCCGPNSCDADCDFSVSRKAKDVVKHCHCECMCCAGGTCCGGDGCSSDSSCCGGNKRPDVYEAVPIQIV